MSMSAPPRVRRVLMTADCVGGVWTYALDLAQEFSRQGLQTLLAVMGQPLSAEQRSAVQCLPSIELVEYPCKLEWMAEPWEDVASSGVWLLDLAKSFRPDLIHLNMYSHAALPFTAPKLVVGHSCVCTWHEAVKGERAGADWEPYRAAVRQGLQAADAVTAPTDAMLTALWRNHGPFRTAPVIRNGRPLDQFKPETKAPFILSVGRFWDEEKNLRALDEVAAELAWPVYAAGACESPDGVGQAPSHVQTLGVLPGDALADWYGRAAIFAHPARYEPFGLAVLEAAMAGCALVLGDIPTLREVWGWAAVYVSPHDRDGLARALTRLIESDAERHLMSDRARRRARCFTAARMARAYRSLYERMAQGRSASGQAKLRRDLFGTQDVA